MPQKCKKKKSQKPTKQKKISLLSLAFPVSLSWIIEKNSNFVSLKKAFFNATWWYKYQNTKHSNKKEKNISFEKKETKMN